MKKIALCFLLFIAVKISLAQQANFEWVRALSNSINKNARAVMTDADGNVYTVGQFAGTIDFDPGPAVFNLTAHATDVYIVKFDKDGNFSWARQVGGTGTVDCSAAYIDPVAGILYCAGRFQGNIDFDPGAGNFNLTTTSYSSSFILKLHVSGTFIWAKQIMSSTAQSNTASSIKCDQYGNVYTTGNFSGSADFDPGTGFYNLSSTNSSNDLYILKLDVDGNFVWTKQISGARSNSTQAPASLSLDNAGNIYTAGYFDSTVDFDPGTPEYLLTSNGDWDAFVLKLNNDGDFIWAKAISGPGQNGAASVTAAEDGDVYLAGYLTGSADFDPGAGTYILSSAGNSDGFICRMHGDGSLVWAKIIGGSSDDAVWAMCLDNTQHIYCTGYFKNTVDFDPGPAMYYLSSAGTFNTFMLKLNSDGEMLWAKQLAAPIIFGSAIAADGDNNIYTTGNFIGQADFDPGAGVYTVTSAAAAEYDVYIHKLHQPCTAGTFDTTSISACTNYTMNNSIYRESGTYRQVLLNVAGCDSTVILQLTINRLHTTVDITACGGYFAGGTLQHTSGIYNDTLQTTDGCDSVVITNLTIRSAPVPVLGADRDICPGESLTIQPGIFNRYVWNDSSTMPSLSVNAAGTYWVRVTGSNNCTATDTFKILSVRQVPADFLPGNEAICLNTVIQVSVPGFKTYLWSNGATTPAISINRLGKYALRVTDYYNCSGTDTITITRADCVPFAIPSAFTPNSDGHNDIFKPVINQLLQQYRLVIYNRLGQKVFETVDPQQGWDGAFNGNPQDAGVYVYTLFFLNDAAESSKQNGTLVLIR